MGALGRFFFFLIETLNLLQVLRMMHLQHSLPFLTELLDTMPHILNKGGEGYHMLLNSHTYILTFI